MPSSTDLATRLLIVYESLLPSDGRATLMTRIDAMRIAAESLGLVETGDTGRDLREVLRLAETKR